jgi:hypothetical protein
MNFSHLLLIYYFSISLAVDVSPIAGHVDRIHQRIPEGKKRENTVKFLKDPKHWKDLLEKAAVKDFAGVEAVHNAVAKVLDDPPLEEPIVKRSTGHELDRASLKLRTFTNDLLVETKKDKIKIEEYVGLWADLLLAYDDVMKESNAENRCKNGKPLGDLVEGFSLALKKLNPNKWDKDFYDKLVKAAENKYYGGYLLFILLGVGIGLLVTIGIIVFFILRRKKKIQPIQP